MRRHVEAIGQQRHRSGPIASDDLANHHDGSEQHDPERAARILYDNHYGWFQKTGRGEYRLKAGKANLIAKENADIWRYYEQRHN